MIFSERIKENGFTDERLKKAVNYVIDNCVYPTPSLADILSFDKKVTVYTYDKICEFVNLHGEMIFKMYRPIKIEGLNRPLWANIEDINRYKLELFNK